MLRSLPCEMCESNIINGFMARLPDCEDDVPAEDTRLICFGCVQELRELTFYPVENGELKQS
jgi:hypothetical protein